MKLFWFIPTHGDGRYLGTGYGGRSLDYSYLKKIACAVDNLGFYGALLPSGTSCEDAWMRNCFSHVCLLRTTRAKVAAGRIHFFRARSSATTCCRNPRWEPRKEDLDTSRMKSARFNQFLPLVLPSFCWRCGRACHPLASW
jgi:hypothetical protein